MKQTINEKPYHLLQDNIISFFPDQNRQHSYGNNIKTMLDCTSEALCLLNTNFDIIAFNTHAPVTMKKFTSIYMEAGMNFIDLLPAFCKDDIKDKLDYVRLGNLYECELQFYNNLWLHATLTPVKTHEGRVREICINMQDVTMRKNIENILRQKAQQYKSLLNSLAEGVLYLSIDKKVIAYNHSAEKILRVAKGQLRMLGFPLQTWKLLNCDKEEIVLTDFLITNEEYFKPIRDFIIGIKRISAIQWLSLNIESIKDKGNDAQAYVISFTDITKQKRISRDLKILLLAAQKVNNSVIVTDSLKQIVWANSAFTKNTGYSFEEVKGKVPGDFLQGKETDPNTVMFMKAELQKKKPFECEIQNYKKTGEIFWMRIQVQPLYKNDGSISGFLGVGADITEQKKLQEKLINQKVEQQKAVTLATIAGQEKERNELGWELHDNINQILAATKIQLEYYLNSNQRKPEYVVNSLKYLNLAMMEIRNLSKHLVTPRFNENKLLTEIDVLISSLGLTQKTKTDTNKFSEEEITEEIKLTIFRILQEQLNNIIKYAKANSILIKLEANTTDISLFIRDDGVGFDTTLNRNGIGLNNIKNRVELYCGSAKIESSPGNGCKLHISIPINK